MFHFQVHLAFVFIALNFSMFPAYADPETELAPNEKLITILSTNDIHGGVEPTIERSSPKDGKIGGMALLSGVVNSIRKGLEKKGDAILVDAGDQFQGTLISNMNEGQVVFASMVEAGYSAVVPGNHDYDFGPTGWLDDRVVESNPDKDNRGALKRLVKQVNGKFPLISANTYYLSSIKDSQGRKLNVENVGCRLKKGEVGQIDWSRAERPDFLKRYEKVTVAGVRVALIGMDNPSTPNSTTTENVSDLCFRNELETYQEIRQELEGQADIFVLILHNGNAKDEHGPVYQLVSKLAPENEPHLVDVVIAGHTHFINDVSVNGVPMIQSFFGGTRFGRVDLVWDTVNKKLVSQKTKKYAAIKLYPNRCDAKASSFCKVTNGKIAYEGVPVVVNTKIEKLVAQARADMKDKPGQKLGKSEKPLTIDRIGESPLADMVTDAFLKMARAIDNQVQIAFVNTSGLRAPLPAAEITYEMFFSVIPFNNRGVIIHPMKSEDLFKLLERAVQTCGNFGALIPSGLKVTFERDCSDKNGTEDKNAKLVTATLLKENGNLGEVLYDRDKGIKAKTELRVVTLDFLADGGEGYSQFTNAPQIAKLDILREALTKGWSKNPEVWSGEIDNRWVQLNLPAK